jgi:hypothetical protein
MLNEIPIDLNILIYNFLEKKDLKPFDATSKVIMRSNLIWKPLLIKKYNINKSINFYEEFLWQKKLKQHQNKYQKQWTLGCVGRIIPLIKPVFMKPDCIYKIDLEN